MLYGEITRRVFNYALMASLVSGSRAMTTKSSSPVRWGILSAGKISSDFCKAVHTTENSEAYAIAARKLESSVKFGREHNVKQCYGSYDELLADPNVDVVYIGSVADQHKSLAIKCLEAGKATVVEKPLALSYHDCEQIIEVAREKNCFLMEGMWTRCQPATIKVQELINSGAIGRPCVVQGDFGWSSANTGPNDRIWFKESGGFILDVGMYLAQFGQVAFGNKARVKKIQAMGDLKNGVDHTALANCHYDFRDKTGHPQTGFLQFYVTGDANTEERVVIQGTKGRIIIQPPAHIPQKIVLEKDMGRGYSDARVFEFPLPYDSFTTWNYPGSIGFTHQIRIVNDCLRRGMTECPYFTWENSLQISGMLDAMRSQVMHGTTDPEMIKQQQEIEDNFPISTEAQ